MITVKVNFANGDSFITGINLDEAGARKYYEGKFFNLGAEADNMQKCTNIELLDD